ncbi:uncharacterized protein LOC144246767 isoform X2 [Lonchura striata]
MFRKAACNFRREGGTVSRLGTSALPAAPRRRGDPRAAAPASADGSAALPGARGEPALRGGRRREPRAPPSGSLALPQRSRTARAPSKLGAARSQLPVPSSGGGGTAQIKMRRSILAVCMFSSQSDNFIYFLLQTKPVEQSIFHFPAKLRMETCWFLSL